MKGANKKDVLIINEYNIGKFDKPHAIKVLCPVDTENDKVICYSMILVVN